jgi:hypothetical protein
VKGSKVILLPFQYGYGDQYIAVAHSELMKLNYIPKERLSSGSFRSLWGYCADNKVILRAHKKENC